jgi:hypothetical protein
VLSQKLTSPEVTGEPPDVTEAVKVTRVPHAVVVTGEPAVVIARAVAVEVEGERIVMGS